MAGRVLVVDDEKMIVKGLKFSLMQDYSVVDCAYDGEEALEYAKNNEYDIILLDIMLPKLDGLSVCQQIREFSDVPIIMLTAKGDDMDKILGLEYGADDYITKPFNILEVKARMKAILRRNAVTEKKVAKSNVINAGDMKIDNHKYKTHFGKKAKMLTPDEVVEKIGHAVGGVCPFGIKDGVTVYLDESLRKYDTVFPACGSSNSAIELTIEEMEKYTPYTAWVDVCEESV